MSEPRLEKDLETALQPGMVVPEALRKLFAWIEENGYFIDAPRGGGRTGWLFPVDDFQSGRSAAERAGGTFIEFAPEGNQDLHYWFGHDDPDVLNKLCAFARTGVDGSRAALWLAPDGTQKIVHLGSGSGSTMVCVLADDPVDFLRLLAIGYDEIACDGALLEPPSFSDDDREALATHPNFAFQRWVSETFGVEIPEDGSEIVRHLALLEDEDSPDPFFNWVKEHAG